MLTFQPNAQYATQDGYTSAGSSSDQQADLLELIVANAIVVARFRAYDGSGKNLLEWGDEVTVTPGSRIYENCAGVEVRSSVSGVVAQCFASLYRPDDPGRPSQAAAFDAYVSPAGTVASVLSLQSGDVFYSASPGARAGVVQCDGSFYDSIADPSFANLFAAIGIAFGGTGANHFAVPDLRDRVPVGAGGNTALAANDGVAAANRHATRHQHSVDGVASHNAASPNFNPSAQLYAVTGGSGVATDPLDGSAFLGLTAYIVK